MFSLYFGIFFFGHNFQLIFQKLKIFPLQFWIYYVLYIMLNIYIFDLLYPIGITTGVHNFVVIDYNFAS
jgi:dolichyl-phosphate-mannose--protein O-mannosyl transferase